MAMSTEIGEALKKVLETGNDAHRCFAAEALGRIGYGAAVEALTVCLRDEDEDVRVVAAEALGLLSNRQSGAALISTVTEDPCNDAKLSAVSALGRLGDKAAIPLLRSLVRGRDESVYWDESEFIDGGWDDWLDIQLKAIQTLGDLGAEEAVPDIVTAIDDEMGQDLAEPGFRSLAKLGEPGARALERYLQAGDERTRRRAAQALWNEGGEDALQALGQALADPSADVRLLAVKGLAALDPADPSLRPLLGDADPAVRASAVELCGQSAPAQLDALLDDPSDRVQAAVIRLIVACRDLPQPKNLAFRLRVKMRGPSEEVAVAACQAAVALLPDGGLQDLCEQLLDNRCPIPVRQAAADALGALASQEALESLMEAAKDDAQQVRVRSLAAVARIAASEPGNGPAAQVLLAALRGELLAAPPTEARPSLEFKEPGQMPPANEGSGSQSIPPPQPEASEGGRTGQEAAEEAQAEDHDDSAEDAPSWPRTTLEALTGEVMPPTQAAPDSPPLNEEDLEFLALARRNPRKKHAKLEPDTPVHRDVRHLAARLLGDKPSADVIRALAETVADEDLELRRIAADSLAILGESQNGLPEAVIRVLTQAAKDGDRDLRLAATRALGYTMASATGVLRECLEDRDNFVRAEAARALGILGAAGPEVTALLADAYPGVRLAAAEALARQGGPGALQELIKFAFAHDGMHRREAARLLCGLNPREASRHFIELLTDSAQERYWRIAVEALEELYEGDPASPIQMVA